MAESNELFKASLPMQGPQCTESLDKRKERQEKNAQAMAARRSAASFENRTERQEKDAQAKKPSLKPSNNPF